MKTTMTKKIYAFIIAMVFSFPLASAQSPRDVQTINPIIGDISFVEKFGELPTDATGEDLRIQTHLAYAENLLRGKDVSHLSADMRQTRTHMLDLLHDYWNRGAFPRNYDYAQTRKPCFIDKNGTICAVGYLVEQTAGREAAEAINDKFKYAFVMEMNDPMVDDWIAMSGLTKEECATIQPDYGGGWGCYCSCTSSGHLYENKICYVKPNGTYGCRGSSSCRTGQEASFTYATALDYVAPNPVAATTVISFYLADARNVVMRLYDVSGRMVTTIADAGFAAGDQEITWDASSVNPGVYFLRMDAGDFSQLEKISVIR